MDTCRARPSGEVAKNNKQQIRGNPRNDGAGRIYFDHEWMSWKSAQRRPQGDHGLGIDTLWTTKGLISVACSLQAQNTFDMSCEDGRPS